MSAEWAPGAIDWAAGEWTNPPVAVAVQDDSLLVTAAAGSDAWRETSYGFVHDSAHALLLELPPEAAMEVSFVADFSAQFDQAGIFLAFSNGHWTKAGVEFADGTAQLGAVVSSPKSDWSVAPVPDWLNKTVTIRVSRAGDALTIRSRQGSGPFSLTRVVPVDPALTAMAGPYCCAPSRAGLSVRFVSWRLATADASLH